MSEIGGIGTYIEKVLVLKFVRSCILFISLLDRYERIKEATCSAI